MNSFETPIQLPVAEHTKDLLQYGKLKELQSALNTL